MASYTDEIFKFNPYTPQLPVEAMVQVGMQKQALYDEGVKTIQSQIDNIAGIDLIKGEHKKYLQSKLDELGGKLRTVAAGDFSNFKLVNSVGGMTNQIIKDPTIQTAVSSTQKFRQEQKRKEELKKQGKSSINREFDFNTEANKWLNDKDVSSSFTGEMKEHVDVNKKVLNILEKLHPNSNIADYPYVINPDGSVNYTKYAAIMQKQGIKTVSEGQIKTAVNSMLEANDFDELASQGRYNYKDYDQSYLQEFAKKNYEASKLTYTEKLKNLEKELLLTTDLTKQHDINNSIEDYKKLLGDAKVPGTLDETYTSILASIKSNPDGARAKLYTKNWLDQIGNGFAYKEITDEVLANPGRADDWKVKEFNFDQIKEQHAQYWKQDESNRGWENIKISKRELERKIAEDNKNPTDNVPYFVGSGDPTTDNLEAASNWANYMGELSTENTGIIDRIATANSKPGIKPDANQVLSNIELYKQNKYQPADKDEKALFDKYIQNSNTLVTQQKLHDDLEAAAYTKIAGAKSEKEAIDNNLKTRGDLVIPTASGQIVRFSAKEVLDYLSKETTIAPPVQGGGVFYQIDDSKLNDREKLIKTALSKRYQTNGGSTNIVSVDKYLGGVRSLLNPFKTLKNKVNTQVANDLAGITGSFKTEQAAVTFKDANEKNRFIGEITNIAEANLNIKVAGQNYTPKELIESIKNKNENDIEIQTVRKGNKYFLNVLDKKDPKNSQRMPIDANFVAMNPSLGTGYLNQGMDLADQSLRNNGSTNIYQDYDHAHYHNGMFGGYSNGKRTVTLPISADIRVGNDGQFYPIFKIKTGNSFISLKYPEPTDYSTFESMYLPSLNDSKILKLFKTQYPNIEQLISQ